MEKEVQLKDTMKESERKKQELDEYRSSVDNLQQWISETRAIAQSAPKAAEASAMLSKQEQQIQEVNNTALHSHIYGVCLLQLRRLIKLRLTHVLLFYILAIGF